MASNAPPRLAITPERTPALYSLLKGQEDTLVFMADLYNLLYCGEFTDKAALIGPAPLAAKFAADIRTKYSNFGLMVDLSHFPICYEKAKDVVRTCRPFITHLHFGNAVAKKGAPGYGDLHQRFGLLWLSEGLFMGKVYFPKTPPTVGKNTHS